ncbi:enoyl-CoA hydratase/isomerase family protein [Pigmentiphaga sp.]|uniref:enoyl-CoA hydratase/isomerase family protein n=1 Tax=Pigmentiphaga sp. TaxID=1977564 RepID=UPI0025DC666C|nr:enoyl-CoA hydratase/isomerase family protein [Pigmentiphaga sp.]
MSDDVIIGIEGPVARIRFNRPEKKNALTYAMQAKILAFLDEAEADDDVRVVVFDSSGADFCSGHDLSEVGGGLSEVDAEGNRRRASQRKRLNADRQYIGFFRRIFEFSKPTVAIVRGYCLGAGLYMAESVDYLIADDSARMGHPEQRYGLSGAAYLQLWEIMTLGARRARELLLLGEIWDAATAREYGLINRVVPAAELEQAAAAVLDKITRLPRDGVAVGKASTLNCYDALGMLSQFLMGPVYHTLSTNMRWEPDEQNFLKIKSKDGVSSLNKKRSEFYKD